ncbi:PEP-CTERM sorting domain-containing protein [Thermodesulfobacteriota bacterium]
MKLIAALLMSVFLSLTTLCPANATLVSTFDTDADGWTILVGSIPVQHSSTGGNPGGYIWGQDNLGAHTWFFSTTTWAGNWTSYIGGSLEFDINYISGSGSFLSEEVRIYSHSDYAYWDTSINPPKGSWTQYEVDLIASNFTISGTKTFNQIMADVTEIWIRGEYGVGVDKAGLDNVKVAPIPEPTTMLLLGSGIIGLAGIRRKFRKK